ncbi:MAG: LacI family DNA-binding transcriptional regulator [Thermomicrobiales bacterium]
MDMKTDRRKPATQRDVARRANVSTAVVSYVINNGPRPTSPEVRERVLQAIADLDYHPNAFARGLRARRTHTIGFVANDFHPLESFGSHYLASILSALTAELKAHGYYLLMYPLMIGEDLTPLDQLLRSERLDGVVVRLVQDPPATDALLDLITRSGIPAVCIERPGAARFALRSVTYDDAAGAHAATSYLVDRGHTRVAHLHGDLRYATGRARLKGYKQALSDAGLPVDSHLIRGCTWSTSRATREMRRLLGIADPPTAVFAASDDIALGALEALRADGRRVPEDVALVGFDDIPLAQELTTPLTTVRIPLADIGRRAAHMLTHEGDEDRNALVDVLPVKLIRRASA